ncbi:MAG: phage regulatory protein/antirepressor Ant [Candidatus Cloacimonetes bacterium]|nr:phage regulatory protein/antirepressor Ant [Candidatus Cloacimonadota bacterium]
MGDLISVRVRIENDLMITDSRNIAEVFKKQHKHVLESIRNLEKDVPNFGQMFFEGTLPDSYGRDQKVYFMNRDGFSLLAMGFTGSEATRWKLKYINAFNALEKAWNTPEQIFARALKMADEKIHSLETDVKRMKPKEIFADAVSVSHTSILIGELAKILKQNGVSIGQNRLFEWLRSNSYLISRSGIDYNMPTQKSMELGLFEIKERTINNPDGSVRITKTVLVNGKGQQYFINKFLS